MKKSVFLLSLIFFLFSFFLCFSFVEATWMAGDMKTTINFVPGMEKTFNYLAGGIPGDYIIYVKGNFSEFFILDKEKLFLEGGEVAEIKAELKLPQTFEPGLYGNNICFLQGKPDEKGGTAVIIRTAACSTINIRVLYLGPKIKINLNAPNLNINEEKEFTIDVISWTEQDLHINGIIQIRDQNNTLLKTLRTEKKELLSGEEERLYANFNAKEFLQGKYNATAIVYYAGESEKDEKTFEIGALDFDILNFTNQFEADKISPFEIEIKSYWNNKVNVDAKIYLKINDSFIKLGETPLFEIAPLEKRKIEGYFDANGLRPISYDAKIILFYEGQTTEKKATITIIPRERIIEMPSSTMILLAVLIIIMLFLIFIIIFMMRKMQKQNKKKKKAEKKKRRIKKQ